MADEHDPINLRVFASQLRTTSDDDVFQLERDVKALIDLPGWKAIETMCAAAAERMLKQLRFANVKDHASMARDIGMGAGIEVQSACAQAILVEADRRRADLERIQAEREREAVQEA